MAESYTFNAPQYVDFTSTHALELEEYGDDYFDMDHEVVLEYHEEGFNKEDTENQSKQIDSTSDENVSPDFSEMKQIERVENKKLDIMQFNEEDKENCHRLRRSMSAGNIVLNIIPNEVEIQNAYNIEDNLSQAVKALELSGKKKSKNLTGIAKNILVAKPNVTCNQPSKYTFGNRSRSVCSSRENLNKTSVQNVLKRKVSVEDLGPNKFISTAEYVNKFQLRTPDRFHSKPKSDHLIYLKQEPLLRTIPMSPMLITKNRTRTVYYKSHEEQEQKEAEEMKKFQIKAHPMNYKIFEPPVLNVKVDRKPNTKPEPFHITEIKIKKPPTPKREVFEFHARPAPKATLHPVIKQSVLPKTLPITPSFMKIRKFKPDKVPTVNENCADNKICVKTVDMHHDGIQAKLPVQRPLKTKVEPFSFEQRDKGTQEKKEMKLKQLLEEEKKKREFHARPIPAQIRTSSSSTPVHSRLTQSQEKASSFKLSTSQTVLLNKENEQTVNNAVAFKARPATVVHKKPFIPKKDDRPMLEINEFFLSTERRAKEREDYDKKLKEKEEEIEMMKKQYEENIQREEMDRIAQIRKDSVHKANPVRHYQHVEILPSTKKLTSPCSPAFTKRKHVEKE